GVDTRYADPGASALAIVLAGLPPRDRLPARTTQNTEQRFSASCCASGDKELRSPRGRIWPFQRRQSEQRGLVRPPPQGACPDRLRSGSCPLETISCRSARPFET